MSKCLVYVRALLTLWEALASTVVYLLEHPQVHRKLLPELKDAISDPDSIPPLTIIEQLLYLRGVVVKVLRMTYGVSSRIHRIAREPIPFISGTGPTGSGEGVVFCSIPLVRQSA